MLRISESRNEANEVTLSLQGSVTGPWIEELARAAAMEKSARSLTLDLADVTFVDRDAVPLLQQLARLGVRVERCSAFVRTVLKEICRNSSVTKES